MPPRVAKYDRNEEPIEGYRLVDYLGSGQFGEVWKALDTETGKLVAIKIIDLSHSGTALKELKALNLVKNLNHPHLIPILTAALKDKNGKTLRLNQAEEAKQKGQLRELMIIMALAEKSLSTRLKEINPDGTDPNDYKGIALEEMLPYMMGAAKGIDFLNRADHGLGVGDGPIVHCDIKPDNIMIVAGEAQIADCGVAVIITPDARQTKAVGSPAYSAPELTRNKPTPGTDQYALAISYYELRTGRLPFDETLGQLQIMLAHEEGNLDFRNGGLESGEVLVLQWATAKRPQDRYPTCLDMIRQLERACEGLNPLPPNKVPTRTPGSSPLGSGTIPTPGQRTSAPRPTTDSHRSTPSLGQSARNSDEIDFDKLQVADKDRLRETSVPDSDRILAESSHKLQLPPVNADSPGKGTGTSTRSTADFPPPHIPSTANLEIPAWVDPEIPKPDEVLPKQPPQPPEAVFTSLSQVEVRESTHYNISTAELQISAQPDPLGLPPIPGENEVQRSRLANPSAQRVPALEVTDVYGQRSTPSLNRETPKQILLEEAASSIEIEIARQAAPDRSRKYLFVGGVLASAAIGAGLYVGKVLNNPPTPVATGTNAVPITTSDAPLSSQPPIKTPQAEPMVPMVPMGTKVETKDPPKVTPSNDPPKKAPPTRDDLFKEALAKLPVAEVTQLKPQAESMFVEYGSPEQQKQIRATLLKIGSEKPNTQDVVQQLLTTPQHRKNLSQADLDTIIRTIVSWRVARHDVEGQHNTLIQKLAALEKPQSLQAAVAAASKSRESFEAAILKASEGLGDDWNPIQHLTSEQFKLRDLAKKWQAARDGSERSTKDLVELAVKNPSSEITRAMAMEYFRLTKPESSETLDDWRKIRDASKKWPETKNQPHPELERQLQGALAESVATELKKVKPDFAAIRERCGTDHANGWALAADAEGKIGTSKIDELRQQLDAAEKHAPQTPLNGWVTYTKLVRGLLTERASDLALVADDVKKSGFLEYAARRDKIATTLRTVAIKDKNPKYTDPIKEFGQNPFPKNAANVKYLQKAVELKPSADDLVSLTLLAAADGQSAVVRESTKTLAYPDEAKISPDELPTALAYFKVVADQADLPAAMRADACAKYCRTAFRLVTEQQKKIMSEAKDKIKAADKADELAVTVIKENIASFATKGLTLGDIPEATKFSLQVCQLRCKTLTTQLKPDQRAEMIAQFDTILAPGGIPNNHPDFEHASACRAYLRIQKFFDKKNNEKRAEWDKIEEDARAAYERDRKNFLAAITYSWLRLAEYSLWNKNMRVPDDVLKPNYYRNRVDVGATAQLLKETTENLIFDDPELWSARANFLRLSAEDIARAGGNMTGGDTSTIREYLEQAIVATKKAKGTTDPDGETLDLANIAANQALFGGVELKKKLPESLKLFEGLIKKDEKAERARIDKARTVIRAVMADQLPKDNIKAIGDELTQVIEKTNNSDLRNEAKYWQAVRLMVAENEWATIDKALREVIPAANDLKGTTNPISLSIHARILQIEAAFDERKSNPTSSEAEKTFKEALNNLLIEVKSVRLEAQTPEYYSFVPDYLAGRMQLLSGEQQGAATSFTNAYAAIRKADEKNTLRVDWPWAIRCLAWEINECPNELTQSKELAARKAYLKQLQTRFEWSLNSADRALVRKALR